MIGTIFLENKDRLTSDWKNYGVNCDLKKYTLNFSHSEFFKTSLNNILRSHGFCIVKNSLIDSNLFLQRIHPFLGYLMDDDRTDFGYSNASIMPVDGKQRYIFNNKAQPLHTDFGYSNNEPNVILLYCEKQAKIGGESIVFACDDIISHLNESYGDMHKILYDSDTVTYFYNTYHQKDITAKKSVFFEHNGKNHISFSLFAQKILGKTSDHELLFNEIINFVHKPGKQIWLKLQEGDSLILNNNRVLHGRNSFSGERLLRRFCYKDNSFV